ncbi:MAG TPA: PSD1 and planctomycete cytochrome C domain-containing protein [Verrucomicrobiae bacterium]
MKPRPTWSLGLALTTLLSAVTAFGADPKEAGEVLFVHRIQPLFKEKCLACHGDDEKKIKGDLDMRTLVGLLKGGESEKPSVIAGKPEESPLYLAATRLHENTWSPMPPKENDKLTPEQLAYLKEWIVAGAPWPEQSRWAELEKKGADKWAAADGVPVKTSGGLSEDWTNRRYKPENLWAYQPLKKPAVPAHSKNPVDAFLAAKMPEGLSPAPLADRLTLLRRVSYDLIGWPPTPAEVTAFLNDPLPDEQAFAKVVERLLASPHYGERWGRHWLDVVRYADSSGFANDYERGNTWRYRDYVVRSFNADKPYDQFIREQIAGDELYEKQKADAKNPELLIATGFLRMGPWELTGMEVAKIARQRFLDDVTDGVGQVFLAHMLQCARCHDHKFDPIPTRDYYSMQAVFATTQLSERAAPFLAHENVNGFEEKKYLDLRRTDFIATLQRLDEKSVQAAQGWFKEKGIDPAAWNSAVEQARNSERGNGRRDFNGVFNATRAIMGRKGVAEEQFPPKLYGFTPEDYGHERMARKGLERLKWEQERYLPFAFSVYNGGTPDVKSVTAPIRLPKNPNTDGELEEVAILTGGDPFSPAQKVTPAVLSAVSEQGATIPNEVSGRRTALADWIASPQNPLTARTMVNRLWLWHFGQPIAGNPNNFGATGKKPTHPELLDWLAASFIEQGWSVKAMHRMILSSEAYRRSSAHPDFKLLAEKDANSTSYSVFAPRRLTAEELRDSMLLVSGELNPVLGGIPSRPEINLEAALQPRQVMGTFASAWEPSPKPEQRHRRSLYALKIRGLRDPFMEVFNEPGSELSCEAREASTITPQVFSLFNGESTFDRAIALAARLKKETKSREEAVKKAFSLAYGRAPRADEMQACLAHWEMMKTRHEKLTFAKAEVPKEVVREAVEENTGEKFKFTEKLHAYHDFVPDLKPADVDADTRALAEVCLVIFNSNEFAYVY